MRTWKTEEERKLTLAIHKRKYEYDEMSSFVGTRKKEQCKSHLQKVQKRFEAFNRHHKGTQQTVYTSYLLYLTHYASQTSANESYQSINPRPSIVLDEEQHSDAGENMWDFCHFDDLATSTTLDSATKGTN